ncbi:MAG: RNA pseudouridine synthase, partial [Pseudomonadota bacterium]
SLKYQIVGDPLYGPQQSALRGKMKKAGYEDEAAEVILNFPRQALHATEIAFIHPRTEEEMHFEINLPDDFQELLDVL